MLKIDMLKTTMGDRYTRVKIPPLNAVITPKYRAAVEKRVYSDTLLVGIPDVAVFQRSSKITEPQQSVVTLSEPLVVTVPKARDED